ncbi:hypothetical protein ACFVGY_25225 [Streptomyces sp. NPDC127106]|uniref:hypothetical protein n=1 Tax=Streptomyces sp. NPDC127106 TaxID=3345360 RepID=UPI00363404AB
MPARTAARRTVRAAAATAVVAAVAGTALMPLSAYAAPSDGTGVLKVTMADPDPSGPLKRGGAAETFELTVTNTSDKAAVFHPQLIGTPSGPSPLQKDDVTFKVVAADGQPTTSFIEQKDGGWQGTFHAAGKPAGDGYEVPANRTLTWKVTIGLGANYPTNLGDFKLDVLPSPELAKDGTASHTLKTDSVFKAGKLNTWFDGFGACQGSTAPDCLELNVKYLADGDGAFHTPLATRLELKAAGFGTPDFQVRAQVGGTWQDVKSDSVAFDLPVISEGFGAASGERTTRLQVKLVPKTKLTMAAQIELKANVAFTKGNPKVIAAATGKIELAPATSSSPSPSPTTSASPSPSASTTASASASPSASASTTAAAGGTTSTTTTGSGTLANTGANSHTGLYSALAAALVATGGAAVWLGARRRKAVSGSQA